MTDFPHRRICVVGTTGAGKSTLAAALAGRLHIPRIELDALYWEPGWQQAADETLQARVEAATRGPAWVVDGNYGKVRHLTWTRAEALVWLDYPLPVILWRLWRRTWRRVLTREVLWGTNTERLWPQFFNKDSLFLWALQTYRRRRRDYAALPGLPAYAHLRIFHFKKPS